MLLQGSLQRLIDVVNQERRSFRAKLTLAIDHKNAFGANPDRAHPFTLVVVLAGERDSGKPQEIVELSEEEKAAFGVGADGIKEASFKVINGIRELQPIVALNVETCTHGQAREAIRAAIAQEIAKFKAEYPEAAAP